MIIIVGGGVAGLSLGWQLAKKGVSITLLEQSEIGSGASQAAGAYLEPRLGTGAMRSLEWSAIKLWRAFADDVEEISGRKIDFRRDGQIRIAFEDSIEKVRADHHQRVTEGWRSEWLEGSELRKLEPNLSPEIIAGAVLPDVDWCDGRKLCAALATGIEKLGGTIETNSRIASVLNQQDRIEGVLLDDGKKIHGDKVVLCSGMGTSSIACLPSDIPKPRPVKGVMLSLAMDRQTPLINKLIKHSNGILCPRSDGRLLVGVTHEDGETSLVASNSDIDRLKESAVRAVPKIRGLPLIEAAVGIRSLVGDGTLRLGKSQRLEGLYYSLSHAGTGFLRAPAISEDFSDFLITDEAACPNIDKFLQR